MGEMYWPVHSRNAPLELRGVLIPADDAILTPPIRQAILSGRFEGPEANALPGAVQHGDRVLEIGAGLGFISTLLSRDRRVARILAVEANPRLLDYMARLHALNGVRKVQRINAVLTNRAEERATFYVRRDFWMGSLIPGPNPYLDTVEVPTRNLNRLLKDEGVTLIVCDIEGAETELFDGADLSGVDRILIEVHDHVTGLGGILALFETLGRQGFAYDPRHSQHSVILFQRVHPDAPLRPYAG